MTEESKQESNLNNILSQINHLELCIGYNDTDSKSNQNDDNTNNKKKNTKWRKPTDILVNYSIFNNINPETKQQLIKQFSSSNINIDRSIGCMIGMGIGDAVGAPLEFQAIDIKNDINRPKFILQKQKWIHTKNKFRLKPGQWTDDAAMGLCMADSLLIHKTFNGSDIRIRFWNWWFNGYNNAFHNDKNERGNKQFCQENNLTFLGLTSIGLGKNISNSLLKLEWNMKPKAIYSPKYDSEDSGNGSLIRLAPIPIYYHKNIKQTLKYAALSSFTTHPGYPASESCKLLAFIIVNAIDRQKDNCDGIKMFLENVMNKYLKDILEKEINELVLKTSDKNDKEEVNLLGVSTNKLKRELAAKLLIKRLIESVEIESSKEICWNWKCTVEEFKQNLLLCMDIRKWGFKQENKESEDDYPDLYNNYPVEKEYFGSYCNDGLAMALNSVYNSNSFGNAIEYAVNLLGDADSTGSIAGQIAGAYYGYNSIVNDEKQSFLVDQLVQWDDYNFGLHGVLLYLVGQHAKL